MFAHAMQKKVNEAKEAVSNFMSIIDPSVMGEDETKLFDAAVQAIENLDANIAEVTKPQYQVFSPKNGVPYICVYFPGRPKKGTQEEVFKNELKAANFRWNAQGKHWKANVTPGTLAAAKKGADEIKPPEQQTQAA